MKPNTINVLLCFLLLAVCLFQLWLDANGLSLCRFLRKLRRARRIRAVWGFSWRVCWQKAGSR